MISPLLVVSDADIVAGLGEGFSGDVEPAVAGEQLVGEIVMSEEIKWPLVLGESTARFLQFESDHYLAIFFLKTHKSTVCHVQHYNRTSHVGRYTTHSLQTLTPVPLCA